MEPPIVFITCFVTLFAVVISITKDLADIEGDKKFNIDTFATKLGVKGVSYLGSGLLLANYVAAAGAAASPTRVVQPAADDRRARAVLRVLDREDESVGDGGVHKNCGSATTRTSGTCSN